jgi:hypothetical protein
MMDSWTCSRCGCIHMEEQEPISCIMCNNGTFYDDPTKFFDRKEKRTYDEET